MTSGASAYGTFLIWNYHKVLEVASLSGPSQSRDTIDLTSHDSVDSFKEYVAGIIDSGEISVEGNFIKGDALGQINFHTDMQAGTKRSCFIVMPMAIGGAWSFEAIASGFESTYPFDEKIGVSGTLKITGKPVLLVTQSTGMTGLTGKKDGGVSSGEALTILPIIDEDTYAYVDEVDNDTTGVLLTITAAGHTIYAQGVSQTSGVETPVAITLGAAGTDTDILILVHETDEAVTKAPRLYTLTITRPE